MPLWQCNVLLLCMTANVVSPVQYVGVCTVHYTRIKQYIYIYIWEYVQSTHCTIQGSNNVLYTVRCSAIHGAISALRIVGCGTQYNHSNIHNTLSVPPVGDCGTQCRHYDIHNTISVPQIVHFET